MIDPTTGQEQPHPLESMIESTILQNEELKEQGSETNSLLEAIALQTQENDPEPILGAMIENDNQNTEKLVGAIKELKPELEKNANTTEKMVNFLEQMKGEDGHTPTEEELLALIEPRIPAPIKGDDGKTPTPEELVELIEPLVEEKMPTDEKLVELITPLIPPPIKPRDGIDGKDADEESIVKKVLKKVPKAKDGKDGSPDTGEEIVAKLEKLKGNKRLDKSAIKGLDKMQKEIDHVASFGSHGQEYRVGGVKKAGNASVANFIAGANTTITGTPTSDGVDITITATGGGGGAVDSVNGQTGVVVLDADDIDDTSTTNKFVTASDITKLGNLSGTNTGDVTVSDSSEIDFTLTGQQISASIVAGSIDESKLDTSVNASLDLADSALQSSAIGVSVQAYSSVLQNTTASFTTTDEGKLDNITVTQAVNLDTMESDIAALANGMVYKGNWDASAGTFPGSGSAETGWFYTVSVGGTVDSVVFNVGDRLIATTDNASTTIFAGNWTQLDATDAVTSVFGRAGNVVATNGDYTASNITNVPAGNIAATDVQAALNELDTEKVPYTGATADLNLGTHDIVTDTARASTSAGLLVESANGTDVGLLGAGNTANITWYGNHNFDTATQDTIAGFTGAGKTLGSLATATYPSLTELTYVKGVTSAIQTQLDGKVDENGAITGATKTKITYDAKGLVTAGADATTADIADSTNKRYVTDADLTDIGNLSGTNTGDQTITNSSDATSHTVTLSASGGSVQLIEGSGITLTTGGTASAGTVTIAASGGSGATTALDNLASVAINTSLVSDTDETDDLGTTVKKWLNIFVKNIGATATRVTKGWFTDIESTNMPTVGGTPVLTSLTAPQFTTIELGHATDTTLSRVSAGVVAVEGVNLVKAGAATSSGLTMSTSRLLGRTTASTGAIEEITVGSGLSLSGGSLSVSSVSLVPYYQACTDFGNTARFNQATSGTGANTFGTFGVRLSTGATANSYADCQWFVVPAVQGLVFNGSPEFSCTLSLRNIPTGTPNTGTVYVGIGLLSYTGTSIDFTGKHIGFKLVVTGADTYSLYATQGAGGAETASSALTTVTDTPDSLDLCFKVNNLTSVDYYYRKNGGSWSSATNLTTNLPTTGDTGRVAQFLAINQNTANNNEVDISCASYKR